METTGRTAVVTGAGSGIGRATAEALARAGMVVVVADLDGAGAKETTAGLTGEGHQAVEIDVSDAGSLDTLLARSVRRGAAISRRGQCRRHHVRRRRLAG